MEIEKKIWEDVLIELKRAREKWPKNKNQLHAVTEEFGEFHKAMMDQIYGNTVSTDEDIMKEGIQTIVTVLRVLTEGDIDFPYKPPQKGNA